MVIWCFLFIYFLNHIPKNWRRWKLYTWWGFKIYFHIYVSVIVKWGKTILLINSKSRVNCFEWFLHDTVIYKKWEILQMSCFILWFYHWMWFHITGFEISFLLLFSRGITLVLAFFINVNQFYINISIFKIIFEM